ncbi:MAG: aminotransferase class V-fold PLP-dependent enzyme [Defluviitaleaceae bacterium]|nr:aminotransferase class V-fold PLP-dependent enzyme [Defluviitaleaceae bacterium]
MDRAGREDKARQSRAPIMEALVKLKENRIVPFDVPGHKRGKGNPELAEFIGRQTMEIDVNSMKPLDFLSHPISVIKQAEELAAEAFGAGHAFFMVMGTTSSVQAMILSCVKKGDKIIMPRNVHKSALTALILSGGHPVYIDPTTDQKLGISLGMRTDDVKATIEANPDAAAIFLNNPTYYGICSNLREIVQFAHEYGLKVLVDEAHGTHFSFGKNLPISAMAAGADMAAVSMHKSGGSLTQSSFLLLGQDMDTEYVRQIINLMQTTSASYLLMVSLDISRKYLALQGEEIFSKVMILADYARNEINKIGGYYAFGREICNGDSIFDFDSTKLSVNSLATGLAGIEVYDILRDEYDIQIEFGDIGNFLAYLSVGDSYKDIERLCSALSEIYRIYHKNPYGMLTQEYINPIVKILPQEAFYADKESVAFGQSLGRISGESVMCYPPGVPIIAPGEYISQDIIDYIQYAKERGCKLIGTFDTDVAYLNVLK